MRSTVLETLPVPRGLEDLIDKRDWDLPDDAKAVESFVVG